MYEKYPQFEHLLRLRFGVVFGKSNIKAADDSEADRSSLFARLLDASEAAAAETPVLLLLLLLFPAARRGLAITDDDDKEKNIHTVV